MINRPVQYRFLVIALLLCAGGFAGCSGESGAAQKKASQEYKGCVDSSAGDLVVMRDCGVAEQGRWDAKRKVVYDRMLNSPALEPLAKNRLQAVQAAWDQFQRLNCWFECRTFPECGTEERLAMSECSWQMSRDRFRDLERFAFQYGIDN